MNSQLFRISNLTVQDKCLSCVENKKNVEESCVIETVQTNKPTENVAIPFPAIVTEKLDEIAGKLTSLTLSSQGLPLTHQTMEKMNLLLAKAQIHPLHGQ